MNDEENVCEGGICRGLSITLSAPPTRKFGKNVLCLFESVFTTRRSSLHAWGWAGSGYVLIVAQPGPIILLTTTQTCYKLAWVTYWQVTQHLFRSPTSELSTSSSMLVPKMTVYIRFFFVNIGNKTMSSSDITTKPTPSEILTPIEILWRGTHNNCSYRDDPSHSLFQR